MRALLDANVLLRAVLPSDNPDRAVAIVIRAGLAGGYTILTNEDVLDEVRRKVTTKPWLARRVLRADAEAFLGAVETAA